MKGLEVSRATLMLTLDPSHFARDDSVGVLLATGHYLVRTTVSCTVDGSVPQTTCPTPPLATAKRA